MLKRTIVSSQAAPARLTHDSTAHFLHSTAGKAGAFALALALAASGSLAFAQSDKTEFAAEKPQFVSFPNFIENTRSANSNDFLARADSKVRDAAAFEEMRQSILNRYQGVEVTHSFLSGGQHYDCVAIDQQPAVRNFHLSSIAPAPPQELAGKPVTAQGNVRPAQLDSEKPVDEFGNSTSCGANTVPLLRTTLETLSRFATLQDFYHKTPGGAVKEAQARADEDNSRSEFADPSVAAHKYSFTYQYVNNLGGNSNNNIWDPYVNTSLGEVFSLSQEWYVGGSGSGTQTEEVGWVVYPAMFNDERTHFFIFSTPDNYNINDTKYDCWDNTCDNFVQVADFGLLGNYFNTVSSTGGTQYEFAAMYYLYEGNWWLSYQGTWIGYYPGAMYKGGQNTKNAQIIEFGTEGVGTTIWPPEGSGAWPSTGWAHAAYQRNLYYVATGSTYHSYWDSLTPDIPSPACYSIAGPYSSGGTGWEVYFYEGGPGGRGC
ncbi:MAG: neprosin family prolyl endopeptidase [Terracidiphilus sp.]